MKLTGCTEGLVHHRNKKVIVPDTAPLLVTPAYAFAVPVNSIYKERSW
jgi:hypothetical protein